MAAGHQLAAELLDCLRCQLNDAEAGVPGRMCVLGGAEVAWDDCCAGMAWTRVVRSYLTEPFPDELAAPSRCDAWSVAVELEVGVLRCAPQADVEGLVPRAPDCATLEAAAARLDDDQAAILAAILACARAWQGAPAYRLTLPVPVVPLGPDGDCMGAVGGIVVQVACSDITAPDCG